MPDHEDSPHGEDPNPAQEPECTCGPYYALRDKIQRAIADVMLQHDGAMLTSFTLSTTQIMDTGERTYINFVDEDSYLPLHIGLLTCHLDELRDQNQR